MDAPAAEERIAVLDTMLLPGMASMSDCALVLGSAAGTAVVVDEVWRAVTSDEMAGRARGTTVGRRRAAPVYCKTSPSVSLCVFRFRCVPFPPGPLVFLHSFSFSVSPQLAHDSCFLASTYRLRCGPSGTPLWVVEYRVRDGAGVDVVVGAVCCQVRIEVLTETLARLFAVNHVVRRGEERLPWRPAKIPPL